MTGKHNAKEIYGDGELPGDADIAVQAPDQSQADSDGSGEPDGHADLTDDGSLSPCSTAEGSGTVLK